MGKRTIKKRSEYVNFNDRGISLGKRKQAYVKWLMRKKRLSLKAAKLACHRKFRYEETHGGY